MRNKLIYYSVKIHDSEVQWTLRKHFFYIYWLWKVLSLQVVEMLETWESVGERSSKYGIWSTTLAIHSASSVGCVMCDPSVAVENWALCAVSGCRLCIFWCISLICWATSSASTMVLIGIQKAAVDQASMDHKQWSWPFWGTSLTLGIALKLLHSTTGLVILSCCIKSTFSLYITIWSK